MLYVGLTIYLSVCLSAPPLHNNEQGVFVPISINLASVSQERLLLAVLPRHIAYAILSDISGKPKDFNPTVFQKMFIQSHSNVR